MQAAACMQRALGGGGNALRHLLGAQRPSSILHVLPSTHACLRDAARPCKLAQRGLPPAMAQAKQNYRVRNKLETFYTGGTVRSSLDGSLLACACADEVKLLDAATGVVIRTFPGVRSDQQGLCGRQGARQRCREPCMLGCAAERLPRRLRSFTADEALRETGPGALRHPD